VLSCAPLLAAARAHPAAAHPPGAGEAGPAVETWRGGRAAGAGGDAWPAAGGRGSDLSPVTRTTSRTSSTAAANSAPRNRRASEGLMLTPCSTRGARLRSTMKYAMAVLLAGGSALVLAACSEPAPGGVVDRGQDEAPSTDMLPTPAVD